jgi:hypothetical protein
MIRLAFLLLLPVVFAEFSYPRKGYQHTVKFINSDGYQSRKGITYGQYACLNISQCPIDRIIVCTSNYYWKWTCYATFPEEQVFDSVIVRCGDDRSDTVTHETCNLEYTLRLKYFDEKIFELLFNYLMEYMISWLPALLWTVMAILILGLIIRVFK